jgi:aldose 1-epimerase
MEPMATPTLPLTGAQFEITAGDYQANITQLGAGLRSLTVRGQPVVTGYQPDELPPAGAGQLLIPWPNRIDHGRYDFGGRTHQLDLSEPAHDNAIHGLTRWLTWQLAAHSADSAELTLQLLGRPGYPFRLDLTARYQLTQAAGLEVTITARNTGSRHAPFGTGSHPYLRAGTGLADDWQLQLPAALWQPADTRGIPDGKPQDVTGSAYDFRDIRPIGSAVLDHAFTGLDTGPDGRALARLAGPDTSLALWAGSGYRWLQVFTGDPLGPAARRRAVAIEPMTCPPNAFVTGTDLQTIEPGAQVTHSWGIQASG